MYCLVDVWGAFGLMDAAKSGGIEIILKTLDSFSTLQDGIMAKRNKSTRLFEVKSKCLKVFQGAGDIKRQTSDNFDLMRDKKKFFVTFDKTRT